MPNNLNGLVFALSGTLSVSRAEAKAFIEKNGGTVASSLTKKVTHLVTTPEEAGSPVEVRTTFI
jgi:NAD-dependent DNA ligase